MARLAYFAPGVYVEEIPSARQPIAGVGTNTVGFIGIVPDTIYCPVSNPGYDPVAARNLLRFSQLSDAGQKTELTDEKIALDADVKRLSQDLRIAKENKEKLDREVADLKAKADKDLDALEQAVESCQADFDKAKRASDEAKAAGNNTEELDNALQTADEKLKQAKRDEAETKSARRKLPAKNDELETKNNDIEALEADITIANNKLTAKGGPPKPLDFVGDDEFEPMTTDDTSIASYTRRSIFRPYYLAPFNVGAMVEEYDTKLCTNFTEYTKLFGDFSAVGATRPLYLGHHLLTHAVYGFFNNGGTRCFVSRLKSPTSDLQKALEQFESIDDVAILAAPGLPKRQDEWEALQSYCEDDSHMNVFAILHTPLTVGDDTSFDINKLQYGASADPAIPRRSTHAAYYFPHIEVMDPAKRLQDSDPVRAVDPKYRGRTYVAPSGHIAGIYARTDEERGVHKAPANATVRGALEVKYYVSKPKQEGLNPQGVNCIRLLNGDVKVWGARTIGGDSNGEWKYVNVRRFAGFLEESIDEGTQWIVFEPNDPSLWSKINLNITAFLTNVWRNGALFGLTQQEAFYVKCDAELNPPEVRDLGQVITEIGVAIVRPAEFVIFRITQSTGQQQG